jgi:protein TonB
VRLDSPFVLAFAGTIAIHVLLVVAADAIVVTNPYRPPEPAPRITLVDVELPVPTPPKPLPPPPPPLPRPEVARPVVPDETPRKQRSVRPAATTPPPETPPPATPPTDDPGGDEVVQMDDIAPAATGVAVRPGPRNTGHVGRGGSGGGTGAGSGSGTADAAPMSVATIKTAALPRGDYGYFKDYPPQARQLGIEGTIKVRLIVDTSGKVKAAVLLNRLGHGLDELALARAKEIEFTPAKDTDDRPVTSVVVWTFHMTLPK